ncbi:MFS transporter [Chloroflexota bacterium]
MIRPRNNSFYGWFVLAGAMLVFFTSAGTFFFSYGVFLPVISETLGWSRAAVGAGLSIGLLTFGLPSPIIGASITKFGPRKNIIFGNSLAALGMFGMSQCSELWHLYFFFGVLVGLGAGFGLYLAGTTLINNWFIDKRVSCMGLLLVASGLGGFVFPPLASSLIANVGWQITWIVFGGMNLIFAVLIGGLVLIRNAPEDLGQVPYGDTVEPFSSTRAQDLIIESNKANSTGWYIKQAIKEPAFWLIVTIGATNYYAFSTMIAHQIAYLNDIGFSTIGAALVFSLLSGMGIMGRLGLSVLALRINLRKLVIVSFVMQLSALGILLATKNHGLMYLYAVLFGISCGAIVVALPAFVGEYFGRTRYPQIMSFAFPLCLVAESMGPVIAGAIYDTNTTYTLAFILVTFVSLLGLIGAVLLRRPQPLNNSRNNAPAHY